MVPQFTWDLACGETFNGTESGEFASPGFPDRYSDGLLCDYKIIAPPQDFVQIEFQDPFEIESELNRLRESRNLVSIVRFLLQRRDLAATTTFS